ncbi:MAG: hypothetical protein BAJATHORv1_60083 [Candidatus Thorarchaeota archaeon]|nr:MAG: hypothetical protein BAJATHORv1_60083 [Candidatus Thorarchaeota archaeon]
MVLQDYSQLKYSDSVKPIKLGNEHISELKNIYRLSGTAAWTPTSLKLGPFWGVFDSNGRLLSVAGVHYVTPYVAEIGNIATRPEGKRKGYASACIAAVVRELIEFTDVIALHFFESNIPAKKLYEKMGFRYTDIQPLYFVQGRY